MSILIDTGVFYAFYNRRDVHHKDSLCLLTHILEGRFGRPYTVDLVVSEAYTLLRYRIGFEASLAFLRALKQSGITIIFLDEEGFRETLKVLKTYSNRNLSFTDAFLVASSITYEIPILASYDVKSFSGIIRSIIGRGYANSLPKEEYERIENVVSRYLS